MNNLKAKIILFFKRAFAPNSLLHGALMAALAIIVTTLKPYVMQWISQLIGGTVPQVATIEATLLNALQMGISAFLLYISKNGFVGSAQISTPSNNAIEVTPGVTPKPTPTPTKSGNPPIFQKGQQIN